MLPEQWKIHNVFHVDLLTPYRETEFHGANYAQPPPDLVGEEEQYEVEQVLDERNHGCWKKKQYLVKWKGYPDSDNQWLDAKDMENTQELIAEFHDSNPRLSSHIKEPSDAFMFSIPPLLLHRLLSLITICPMPLTPPTSPPPLKRILLHSLYLHTQLPQMLPRVQYTRKSKKPLSRNESQDSSESVRMALPTSLASTSHTLTSLPLASSTTLTKKTSHHHLQPYILVPQFKQSHSAECEHPFHSPTTNPSIKPSLQPLPEYEAMSTVAVRTSSKLKRLSESAGLSNTVEHPVTTKKQRCLCAT